MRLDRVTITGADHSVEPHQLLELSREFPFVEWGILVSRSNTAAKGQAAAPRWPSFDWIESLRRCARKPDRMDLALHVCGHWVRQLLLGENEIPREILEGFERVQLNFHGESLPSNRRLFPDALLPFGERQIIFQLDGAMGLARLKEIWEADPAGDFNAVGLHDVSHGAGVSPKSWPAPVSEHVYQGYAGGLGPENFLAEIVRIADAAKDARVWVDMETRVRSSGDRIFDLSKVRAVLEAARPFVFPAGSFK